MAIMDIFKKKETIITEKVHPTIYVNEAFKSGEKEETKLSLSKDTIDHPFDFAIVEQWYKDDAFVTGVIDKFLDYTIGGGFYVKSADSRAQAIIEQFMIDYDFDGHLRNFIKSALIYGNGFMEIVSSNKTIDLKDIDPKTMYVRKSNGELLGYSQIISKLKKPIDFKPKEIAHYAHKKIANSSYGYGVVYSLLYYLKNKARMIASMNVLMERKANSPYVATLGSPEEPVPSSDVTAVGKQFELLNNKHEWTFNHLVKVDKLDFGAIGDKFSRPLELLNLELVAGAQVPEVLLGRGSIPEGLARVQQEAFERRISSIQEECEKVIEAQIFSRVLELNGLGGVHVEFEWGQPSDLDKREEITSLQNLLDARFGIFGPLRVEIEKKLANLLGFENVAVPPAEERQIENKQPQPQVPRSK